MDLWSRHPPLEFGLSTTGFSHTSIVPKDVAYNRDLAVYPASIRREGPLRQAVRIIRIGGEVVAALEGVGVVGAEDSFPGGQGGLVEGGCFGGAARFSVVDG